MLSKYIATLLSASTATAQVLKGFNYGATTETGACQDLGTFTNLFNRANSLSGAPGFTSARLYTTVQCGTANSPTSAIQAAINTNTKLLLGMWASAGSAAFQNEIVALTSAIQQYPSLADNVVGISIGSEDLYRSSPQGVANNAGVGADAATIVSYIGQVRQAISGTSLASKPIGHVDTWTAWILPENIGVAQAVDWLGHNSFPYFETTRANSIEQGTSDFNSALAATESISGGRPVWVTETGWPHNGPQSGQAVASVANAETYWKSVGCSLFGNRNTWWYTLEDANTAQTDISFGVTPTDSNTPIFDLSCSDVSVSSSQSSSQPSTQSSTQSSTSAAAQSTTESTTQSTTQLTTQSATQSTTESTSQSAASSRPTSATQIRTSAQATATGFSTSAVAPPASPISRTSSVGATISSVVVITGPSTPTAQSTVTSTAVVTAVPSGSNPQDLSSTSEGPAATSSGSPIGVSNKATKVNGLAAGYILAVGGVLALL